jgi:hypothetical protein
LPRDSVWSAVYSTGFPAQQVVGRAATGRSEAVKKLARKLRHLLQAAAGNPIGLAF